MMYGSWDITIGWIYYGGVRRTGGIYGIRTSALGGGRMYYNIVRCIGMCRSRDVTIARLHYSSVRSVSRM